MEFQTISVDALVANDYNPNEMTDEEFQECKREIAHLGTLPKPIVVRPKDSVYAIVDGEHNWRAAKELGFTTVPCEVLELDDVEAMRQSYKRNMHGKFNPVKLGKMFERALEQTGSSQRALADQYEISEGTVRNALLYSQVARLRNGYAFEILTIRQVRLYLALPPIIRDKWLEAGADTRLILGDKDIRHWEKYHSRKWTDASFDAYVEEQNRFCGGEAMTALMNTFQRIYEAGLADMVKGTRAEFRKSIDWAVEFLRWEYWTFHHGDAELRAKVREYTQHYYDVDSKYVKDEFARLYRLICLKGKFVVTPEEFAKIAEASKQADRLDQHLEPGRVWKYPNHYYMEKAIQVLLIEKGILEGPVNVHELPDPGARLMELQLEKNGPDYIKQADLPVKVKAMVFDYSPLKPIDLSVLEQAKKEALKILVVEYAKEKAYAKEISQKSGMDRPPYFNPSEEWINETISKRIAVILDKLRVGSMTNDDIVGKVIAHTRLYKNAAEKEQLAQFKANLLRLNREELLAIFYVMDYMNYIKEMRKGRQ